MTSPISYVRLHHRNYRRGSRKQQNVRERYDFLYSVQELGPWAARVREIARKTQNIYVMSNNHNLEKAAVNAIELTALLKGERVSALPQLVEHYPELAPFVSGGGAPPVSESEPSAGMLFGPLR